MTEPQASSDDGGWSVGASSVPETLISDWLIVQRNKSIFWVLCCPATFCRPVFSSPLAPQHCKSNQVESKYCDAVLVCSFNIERGRGVEFWDFTSSGRFLRLSYRWNHLRGTALPVRKKTKTNFNRSVVALRFKGINAAITAFTITLGIWCSAF